MTRIVLGGAAGPSRLAIRPLLFGARVALLGVVLGIAVGLLVGIALRFVFVTMLPLPIWRTPFQLGTHTTCNCRRHL